MNVCGFFVGDIIGNSFAHENESFNKKIKDFKLFTNRSKFSDDTILTFATINWLLSKNKSQKEMFNCLYKQYQLYPDRNPTIYGESFVNWVESRNYKKKISSSNGGAMRVSPIGYFAKTESQLYKLVKNSICVTHNSQEGIEAAEIVALAVFLFKNKFTVDYVRKYLTEKYKLSLNQDLSSIRDKYVYTSSGYETVRPALISVFEAKDFEDAVRNAVSVGGDTDTITSIASAIAEARFGGIPEKILKKAIKFLPKNFIQQIKNFNLVLEKGNLYGK